MLLSSLMLFKSINLLYTVLFLSLPQNKRFFKIIINITYFFLLINTIAILYKNIHLNIAILHVLGIIAKTALIIYNIFKCSSHVIPIITLSIVSHAFSIFYSLIAQNSLFRSSLSFYKCPPFDLQVFIIIYKPNQYYILHTQLCWILCHFARRVPIIYTYALPSFLII